MVGVARLWAPLAATLVIDEADADLAGEVEAAGMRRVVAPTIMTGPAEAAALARVVARGRPARGRPRRDRHLADPRRRDPRGPARATTWPS